MENVINYTQVKNTLKYNIKPEVVNFNFTDKNGEKYFFKANGEHSYDYNEIIANIISKTIGISNTTFLPCTYIDNSGKRHKGLLSKDYNNNKEVEIFSLQNLFKFYNINDSTFNVQNIINLLSTYIYSQKIDSKKEIELDPNIRMDLIKTCLLLYLTGQQDFNASNFEFKIEKKNNKNILSMQPYIDNSISFFKTMSKGVGYTKDFSNAEKVFNESLLPLSIDNETYELPTTNLVSCELSLAIFSNPELKEIIKKVYQLDLKNEINNFCKNNNFKVEEKNTKAALTYFNLSKKVLHSKIQRIDNSFATNLKFSHIKKDSFKTNSNAELIK